MPAAAEFPSLDSTPVDMTPGVKRGATFWGGNVPTLLNSTVALPSSALFPIGSNGFDWTLLAIAPASTLKLIVVGLPTGLLKRSTSVAMQFVFRGFGGSGSAKTARFLRLHWRLKPRLAGVTPRT